jgi:hypothetical protein
MEQKREGGHAPRSRAGAERHEKKNGLRRKTNLKGPCEKQKRRDEKRKIVEDEIDLGLRECASGLRLVAPHLVLRELVVDSR